MLANMNLSQYLGILRARKKLIVAVHAGLVLTVLGVSLVLPEQFTAETVLALDTKANDPVTGQPVQAYLVPGYMESQMDILASQNSLLYVVDTLGLAKSDEAIKAFQDDADGKGSLRIWLADRLAKKVDIKPSKEGSTVSISFTSPEPHFSAAVANAIAQGYVHTLASMRTSAAQQNNVFFQQQLKVLQGNLEQAQQELASYLNEKGIVAADEKLDVEMQRLNDISTQLVQVQSAAMDAQSRTRGAEKAPDVLNNPLIQQIKNQLTVDEGKFRELATKVGPEHPHYKEAQAQVESDRRQLQALTSEYASGLSGSASNAENRAKTLRMALDEQKKKILELKQQRSLANVLQRKVEGLQKAYDAAQDRFTTTSLQSRSMTENVGVVKEATEPAKPSRPRILLNVLAAFVLGGVIALCTALLAEILDRRVRCARDVESLLGMPVLATIGPAPARKKRSWAFWRNNNKVANA
ncbi:MULTISPECIES: chain length determinant protein EpsF [Aquitalea]|uniref:chain length determinant protein EpsF n=1 Tax=Aquitalea TaxID=407217 RepID=UPI001359B830|nr:MULTISPECIES: chain length determinant protein EpsF [Aquitalea]